MSKKPAHQAEVGNGWVLTHLGADCNITEPRAVAGRTITAIEIVPHETAYEEESDPDPQYKVICHAGPDWFVASLADTHEDAKIDFHRIIGMVDGGAPKN